MDRERARGPFDQMSGNGDTPHQRNPKYRTKLCRNFPFGTCLYGDHCSYLHVSPAPSPVTQYPSFSSFSSMARSMFQPSCTPLVYNDPVYYEPSNAPRFSENRVEQRARVTQKDGARRSSRTPPQTSHVEKWRLSVDIGRDASTSFPPAPPTTPTSTSTVVGSESRTEHGGSRSRGDRLPPLPLVLRSNSVVQSGRAPVAASLRAQKRNQFFRTKPCRFFGEPTGCVKGDRCNFIHEAPERARLPTGLTAPADATSEGEAESAAESSVQGEQSPSTVATSEVTSCASAASEEPKRNFYPVTWRVVGGGVTLGGKRETCQRYLAGRCTEGADCRYAHPDPSEDEYVYSPPDSLFSPISPIAAVSPVLVPYPIMYPIMPTIPTYALPVLPGPPPVTPPPAIQPAPTPRAKHSARNSISNLTVITAVSQPMTMHHAYSPHRVVDGSTLLDREPPAGSYHTENMWAARSVVRPLSTPPTPVHGPDVGIAKLFAAEMP